jgi:hypothetical protein
MAKKPTEIVQKGKGGWQEPVDFPNGVPTRTGGDLVKRRDGRYGKREEVSKETLKSIFDLN